MLWIVDAFTRFLTGVVLKNEEAKRVLKAIVQNWYGKYGYPADGFWADNGTVPKQGYGKSNFCSGD